VTDLAAPVSTIAPSMKDTLAEYMFLWFGVVLEELSLGECCYVVVIDLTRVKDH